MRNTFEIRRATADDIPAVVGLWQELIQYHAELDTYYSWTEPDSSDWCASLVAGHIASDTSTVWIAESNREVIGVCLAQIIERPPVFQESQCGEIPVIAVTTRHRRNGVGRALVQISIEWFKDLGVNRVELRVLIQNEPTRRFFTSLGFSPFLETLSRRL